MRQKIPLTEQKEIFISDLFHGKTFLLTSGGTTSDVTKKIKCGAVNTFGDDSEYLEIVEHRHIKRLLVLPKNVTGTQKLLYIEADTSVPVRGMGFALEDMGGKEIEAFVYDKKVTDKIVHTEFLSLGIDVTLWDFNTPVFYRLTAHILEDDPSADSVTAEFPFREVDIATDGVYLNDRLLTREYYHRFPEIGLPVPQAREKKHRKNFFTKLVDKLFSK